jgi:hypothetical protein
VAIGLDAQARLEPKLEGKTYRLVPGRYSWFVFPGFGKRSAVRYGDLLGASGLTVRRRPRRRRR